MDKNNSIVNLNEYRLELDLERDEFRKLAVQTRLCGQEDIEKIEKRFEVFPIFFKEVNHILRKGFRFRIGNDFYFSMIFQDTPEKVLEYVKATKNIDNEKVFYTIWHILHFGWHKEIRHLNAMTYIKKITKIISETKKIYPDAFISHEDINWLDTVFRRSSEIKQDVGMILSSHNYFRAEKDELEEYFNQGHHFICHPYYFHNGYLDNQKLSGDEKFIRSIIARSDNYPPFDEQERLVKKIMSTNHPKIFGKLLGSFLGKSTKLEYFYKIIGVLSGESFSEDEENNPLSKIIKCFSNYDDEKMVSAINILSELLEQNQNLERYVQMFENGDFNELEQEIYGKKLQEHALKFPEKPIDEVRKAFLRKENDDSESPSEESLDKAINLYEKILEDGKALIGMDTEMILSILKKILPPQKKKQAEGKFDTSYFKKIIENKVHGIGNREDDIPVPTEEGIYEYKKIFFSCIRELFKREFGVYPYNTQMIAILMMIDDSVLKKTETEKYNGTYEQIKTGEGKSLIFALTSAYFASLNRNVDVITSNAYLAKRDAARFGKFYEKINIDCGHFSHNDDGKRNPRILYSTNQDLIFHYLSCRLGGNIFFEGNRHDVALVDEADNLCIDLGEQACRIATPSKGIFEENTMLKFLAFSESHAFEIYNDLPTAIKEFMAFAPETKDIHPIYIGLYLRSAIRSRDMIKGEDFVIKDDKILIVDVSNTGRIQEKTHWTEGLHEFVSLRNGLEMPQHFGVSAQMNHPHFIQKYKRIHCISGTFGDEIDRQEIKEIYDIIGFDVPSHHEMKRVDHRVSVESKKEAYNEKLLIKIKAHQEQGRPLLIITGSINESEELYRLLGEAGIKRQLLNDLKNSDPEGDFSSEEEIIRFAGISGMVTVATSVAGRGADMIPDLQSLKAGGLHSLLTFMPVNKRVEYQARGRAGRQGNPGSSEIFICLENDIFFNGLSLSLQRSIMETIHIYGKESRELDFVFEFIRKCRNLASSQIRIMNLEKEDMISETLEMYFSMIGNTASRLRKENLALLSHNEASSFIASQYLSDTWISEFDYLQTVFSHDDLLKNESEIPLVDDGLIISKLNRSFEKIFGFPLNKRKDFFDQKLIMIIDRIYEAYKEQLLLIERKISKLDQNRLRQMIRKLEEKMKDKSDECIKELGKANVIDLNEFIKSRNKGEKNAK